MIANFGDPMRRVVSFEMRNRFARTMFAVIAVIAIGAGPVWAQSGDARDQGKQGAAVPPTDTAAGRDAQKEFAEAAQAINGPAGNPECVWLGRRVVALMRRDDLDTAFRHLDLYDRFGCPGGHVQAAFRCLTRFNDPKPPETLSGQVHACWINPAAQPGTVAAAPAPAAASGGAAAAPAAAAK
jgi:hypothetical protein